MSQASITAVVAGGGVIGSSVAWRLAANGVHTIVLERARLGAEASAAAAGLIGPQAEAQEPGPFFSLALAAKRSFDASIDTLTDESGIDPEYDRDGVLYAALDETSANALRSRGRWQREAGEIAQELSGAEARKLAPMLSPKTVFALHLPTNRRCDNRKLTNAFAAAAARRGVEFREGARVDEIICRGGRAVGVRLSDGSEIGADVVINAAGAWASEIRGLEQDRIQLRPIRGQMICFESRPGALAPSLFSQGGILVPRRDGRLIAGSIFEEAGYNKSLTLEGMARILAGVAAMAPGLGSSALRETWAGFRPASDDWMPVIGASPSVPNVIYATGHFRSGILLSMLTGEVVADIVAGRVPSADLGACNPARFQSGRIERISPVFKTL